jgi:hypothetical protein
MSDKSKVFLFDADDPDVQHAYDDPTNAGAVAWLEEGC